ncbi:hypothetical protein H4R34_001842 [Dimargaris verticillata]|uniref:NADP-dependent oxidoreductase domain-containing protein n=1 Tax=Dimargaris verticillata TaxID=2761393 RepID=A0A9W8E9W6_9FUNG|nr:hypothetical protein H4R34_001842 [Dimargaris verticillata]
MAAAATTARLLNNGTKIPAVGYGVYELPNSRQTSQLVTHALQSGYRHVDTAAMYDNEEATGRGIHDSGLPRAQIFVTTKLSANRGYQETLDEFHQSLQKLALDYVDLYLIHSPYGGPAKRLESWKAMEKLHHDGLVKSIGVSNFGVHHLKELLEHCTIKPVVNQIELHPWQTQPNITAFCRDHGIAIEAYSPLVRAEKKHDPTLTSIGHKHGKSWAQVLIRWSLQHEYVPLTKTSTEARIRQNLDVFDFKLGVDDMQALDALNEDLHLEWDPTTAD